MGKRILTEIQKKQKAEHDRLRYNSNEEVRKRRLKAAKNWKDKNPDYMKNWQKTNPDKVKEYNLKKNHGLSLVQYRKLQLQQNNQCAICKKVEGDRLVVDHCHTTMTIRGLLCVGCNRGIGFFDDEPKKLTAAGDYLKRAAASPSGLTSRRS